MLSHKEKKLIVALRQQDSHNIMNVAKDHEIPKSTLYDIMHKLQRSSVLHQSTKISFEKVGFPIKMFFIIRTEHEYRDKLKDYLIAHKHTNNVHIINNRSSFHVECIFRNQKEVQDFLEELEEQTPLTQLSVYNLLETLQEEKFLTQESHFE